MYTYKTTGVCSREIHFELFEDKVSQVHFVGGCQGNLKAIAKLVQGMPVQRVIELLERNTCAKKPTSCADQLAQALKQACSAKDRS